MDHATQVELARRMLRMRETRRTELAPEPYETPVAEYASPDHLTLERERLFRRLPLLVGLSADVPEPGDYFTLDAAGLPLLVVRDDDGHVHTLLNVCRHRGAPVAEGRGRCPRRLVCPYHGWSYERDGRLAAVSHREGFPGIDAQRRSLARLSTREIHGLVFAFPSGSEPNPDSLLSGLEAELAPFGLERYTRVETRDQSRAMNWKLVVDTFLEAYHIPSLHRGSLAPLFEGSLALFDPFGRHGRLAAVRRTIAELEHKPESEWSVLPHATILYQIFPNSVLIYQQDHAELWQVFPDGGSPDVAHMRITLYAPEPVASERAARRWRANMDLLLEVTGQEDFALGERAQQGFHSGAQETLVFGRNEPALIHYHRSLHHALGAEPGSR